MKTTIKIDNLDVDKEEFDKIKSRLEDIIKIEPNEKIKKFAQQNDWTIDQKDIFVRGSKIGRGSSYRIEFYHNEKEGDEKKCYLGLMDYI
jgi:hypothetical protein